ncbi:MAG: GAF domain-containing sensor histidine kinase [Candidatus Brocadiales bacterium]
MAKELAKLRLAVEEEKKKFDEIITSINDGLFVLDKDHRVIYWNKKMEEISGLSRRRVMNYVIFGLLPHLTKQKTDLLIKAAMGGEITFIENIPYITPQGRHGFTSDKYFPLRDNDNQIIGVVGVVEERTEKRRLELEKEIIYKVNKFVSSGMVLDIFKALSTELRAAIDFDRISIALLDEENRNFEIFALTTDYNHTKIKEGDYFLRKESLLGKVFSTGMPHIVEDTTQIEFWSDLVLLKEGIRSRLAFPLKYKGVVIGSINFGSKKVNNFSERYFGILEQIAPQVAIAIENTRLFASIKESERKYKDLYDNAPDMYITSDENGIILDCNKTGAKMLGYRREELIGKPIFGFQTEKDRNMMKNLMRKRSSVVQVEGLELQLLRKDGTPIDVSLNDNYIFDSSGKIIAIRSVYRDISERKKLERQLLEVEKLASTGRLVASVAHEINNPLEGIINYLDLLSRELIPPSPFNKEGEGDLRAYVDLIREGFNSISDTVKQLLESHRSNPEEKTKSDVNVLIKNVLKLLRNKLSQNNISTTLALTGNSQYINCNFKQLEQVFINVILNATDAMPDGGTLKIKTWVADENFQVEVADTGCGIAEKDIPNIFEPFFSTKKGSGTGLGLWVSYGIVTAHNGRIDVKSHEGQGTTLSISLPI